MAEELTYRRLCEICREEKSTNSLIALSPDFETLASALLAKMGEDAALSKNHEAARERDNATRLFFSLIRMRRQKVVFRALLEGAKHETTGMTDADHALFDRVAALVSEEEGRMVKLLSSEKGEQAAEGKDAILAANGSNGSGKLTVAEKQLFKKLRILKDVPSYRSADGLTLGPYKIGEEVPLPPSEAEWMVRGRLAEEINGNA